MPRKYESYDKPISDDVVQVVTYAVIKGCKEAVLIYPTQFTTPFDNVMNKEIGIRVKSMEFRIDRNLETAGQAFAQSLFSSTIPN